MSIIDPDPPAPAVGGAAEGLVTIEQFLLQRQPRHASGDLTALLYDLANAGAHIRYHALTQLQPAELA